MKRANYCITIFCMLSVNLYAQYSNKVTILYKSATEFSNRSPSFSFECKSKSKILLNDFFIKNYVTVKQGDSTYRFSKRDLYGYQTCIGQVFRFLNKKELLLLNKNEDILLYRHQVAKPPLGRTNVTNYYFSIGTEGAIMKLTFKNLKAAFAGNSGFLNMIDAEFKYNMDIAGYNEELKRYRVNVLLAKSKGK